MLQPSIVEHLKTSADWKALENHIKEKVFELSLLDGIDFTDKEAASIEGRARQLAIEKLQEILEPFYFKGQEPSDKGATTKARTGIE